MRYLAADIRHNTIHWMAQVIGELQKTISMLQQENERLREKLVVHRKSKAMSTGAGK